MWGGINKGENLLKKRGGSSKKPLGGPPIKGVNIKNRNERAKRGVLKGKASSRGA